MVGNVIRERRHKKGMTLASLAAEVGVTSGGLSQIERGIIDPSLAVLKKIAAALNISLYLLFTEESGNYVSRSKDRRKAHFPDLNIEYEFLTPRPRFDAITPKIEATMMTLGPKAWSSENFEFHEADECFVVISGCFEVHIPDQETVTLYEKDSIYHTQGVVHRLFNPGDTDAVAISILSDVIY